MGYCLRNVPRLCLPLGFQSLSYICIYHNRRCPQNGKARVPKIIVIGNIAAGRDHASTVPLSALRITVEKTYHAVNAETRSFDKDLCSEP